MSIFKRLGKIIRAELNSETEDVPYSTHDYQPEVFEEPIDFKSSFEFKPNAETPEEVRATWLDFIWKICDAFNLYEIEDVKMEFEEGQDIYNTTSHDCRITLITKKGDFVHRIMNFPELTSPRLLNNYTNYFEDLAASISRFLLENDSKFLVVARNHENYTFENRLFTVEKFNAAAYHKLESAFNNLEAKIKFKKSDINKQLEKYADAGLFKLLPINTIERGTELCFEYNFIVKQDVLWCFHNLIRPCCPRESSGYEDELTQIISITNGALTLSDYHELEIDNRIYVKAKINDIEFSASDLPNEFSLKLFVELNEFLTTHFATAFYLWVWERNPWEQICLIYLENKTFDLLENKLKEISIIGSDLAEFYEEHM